MENFGGKGKLKFKYYAEAYLKLGEKVTFITAPRYFGDGYTMPIVAIKTEEKELLKFEDGYKNLIESYHLYK